MKRHSTITSPTVERKCSHGPAAALSAAITLATRAPSEETFYVRDENDAPYGRVERDASGGIAIYRRSER